MPSTGSLTITATDEMSGVVKLGLAWTSDGSGNVNQPVDVRKGVLAWMKFVPGSGGTQPTANYSVQLQDADGVDVLQGNGASLSNTTGKYVNSTLFLEAATYTLVISGAGNAKTGTVVLMVGT